MTPAARLQAAIECLDAVLQSVCAGGPAADQLIAQYFKTRRYAGSKDRRAVRQLVYDVIRWIPHEGRSKSGRQAVLAYAAAHPDMGLTGLMTGGDYGAAPADSAELERATVLATAPQDADWLSAALADRFGQQNVASERAALDERAPLDVRINPVAGTIGQAQMALEQAGIKAVPLSAAMQGLRLPPDSQIEQLSAYREGLIEVQDMASQLASSACLQLLGARDTPIVLDLCAGAGGKALAIAGGLISAGDALHYSGRLLVCDIDSRRLGRLAQRFERAKLPAPEAVDLTDMDAALLGDLQGRVDLVLVDAPCSSTGTWRRNPEARLRITPDLIADYAAVQLDLLRQGARMLRSGGVLVYAVCSVLPQEGEQVVEQLLADGHASRLRSVDLGGIFPGLPASYASSPSCLALGPARHSCDGFFIAALESF